MYVLLHCILALAFGQGKKFKQLDGAQLIASTH